jgi:hypothetical protein
MEKSDIACQKNFTTQPLAGKVILALFVMHKGQFFNTSKRGSQQ